MRATQAAARLAEVPAQQKGQGILAAANHHSCRSIRKQASASDMMPGSKVAQVEPALAQPFQSGTPAAATRH